MKEWIREITTLCQPKNVIICDGSDREYRDLTVQLVKKGTFVPLKSENSFWCHSTADDVARSEEDTYICSEKKENAGPTNQWQDPKTMKLFLTELFRGCMRGRTMYVIPFCMGPLNSPYARLGVQITDSPYVVCNMHLMTRMGKEIHERAEKEFFVPCLHSVGVPLEEGAEDIAWPSCAHKKYIVHFPDEPSIWSFGSGYGGNALLGKKCFALRIGSVLGKREGWLAEHMLIIGVTNPVGEKKYMVAAFPSGCGKTNLAMMESNLPGWKVECIGDDIAWLNVGKDGRLYAINPEYGCFGVAPGTSYKTNPVAMEMIQKNTIFTNTALTPDNDVWWEGMSETPPPNLTTWEGKPWDHQKPASHPNARFTVRIKQCPTLSSEWQTLEGVPISAIIFGGRRSTLVPLVFESLSWNHGVFLGATMSSEMTAAAKGVMGKLRHDPFGMVPFCGYNMGDYFAHWIEMGQKIKNLPQVFHVNWFRKGQDGKYLWPGFRQNMRVIQWIFETIAKEATPRLSPIGYLPEEGLFEPRSLFEIDIEGYLKEAEELKEYFAWFGDPMPTQLHDELSQFIGRLHAASHSKG